MAIISISCLHIVSVIAQSIRFMLSVYFHWKVSLILTTYILPDAEFGAGDMVKGLSSFKEEETLRFSQALLRKLLGNWTRLLCYYWVFPNSAGVWIFTLFLLGTLYISHISSTWIQKNRVRWYQLWCFLGSDRAHVLYSSRLLLLANCTLTCIFKRYTHPWTTEKSLKILPTLFNLSAFNKPSIYGKTYN